MKLNVLEVPEEMRMPNNHSLRIRYPEGKILFMHMDLRTLDTALVATMEYSSNATHFDYVEAVHDYLEEADLSESEKKDFYSNYIVVEPTPKTSVVTTGKHHTTREKFLRDATHVVELDVELVKAIYNVEDKDIFLLYEENVETNEFIYYGYSIDPEEMVQTRMTMGLHILPLAYSVYLQMQAVEAVCMDALENCEKTAEIQDEEIQDEEIQDEDIAEAKRSSPNRSRVSNIMKSEIRSWMNKTSFREFADAIRSRVKGQAEVINIAANVYNYLSNILDDNPTNNNMLLAAPSGCGKTETYRALRDYFKTEIPKLSVYQIDVTSITEEGFKGPDTESIIEPLLRNRGCNGVGLVFLDEFDKKLIPSFTSSGNNVNAAVQAQLLTMLEGRFFEKKGMSIDTVNTMFIGLGSYDVCRKKNVEEGEHHIGFLNTAEKEKVEHYTPITREDMIELGASYEMIGRFSMVVNYYKLSPEIVDEIIDDTAEKIAAGMRIKIRISDKMRGKLHQEANGHYGCRILYSMIHQTVMSGYAQLMYEGELENASYIVVEDMDKLSVRKKRRSRKKAMEEATVC